MGEMGGVDRFGRGRISAHQAVGYRIVPELDDLGAVPERFGNLAAGGHGGDGPPVPRPLTSAPFNAAIGTSFG